MISVAIPKGFPSKSTKRSRRSTQKINVIIFKGFLSLSPKRISIEIPKEFRCNPQRTIGEKGKCPVGNPKGLRSETSKDSHRNPQRISVGTPQRIKKTKRIFLGFRQESFGATKEFCGDSDENFLGISLK